MRSNITWYCTHYCRNWDWISIRGWTHKDAPYLALTGELWGVFPEYVFPEYFRENWPCDNGTILYALSPWHGTYESCDHNLRQPHPMESAPHSDPAVVSLAKQIWSIAPMTTRLHLRCQVSYQIKDWGPESRAWYLSPILKSESLGILPPSHMTFCIYTPSVLEPN